MNLSQDRQLNGSLILDDINGISKSIALRNSAHVGVKLGRNSN